MRESRWTGFAFLLLLLGLWEVAGRHGWVHKLFFPPASRILASFVQIVFSGEVLGHVGASLWRAGFGYLLAALLAITLGVLMGYWRAVYEAFEVVVELLRAVPPPAVIPVAIVFLGVGDQMKIFIILFSCAFPILVNTMDGVRGVDPVLIRTARTFGLGQGPLIWKVVLPAASPLIMTGLRIALAIALILVVISEMVGATSGIGYFILDAQRSFRIPQMYAGMLVLALLGYGLNRCFLLADARLMAWHKGLTARQR
ncbi:MAG: ABC transporter permease [Candidatus Rokubacteria bacterium]|nr:ABC transporter permease [Candidatus Rokubacteria bacterium]